MASTVTQQIPLPCCRKKSASEGGQHPEVNRAATIAWIQDFDVHGWVASLIFDQD
jgi:hypothetical protein